jgi:hypothetical protein
VVGRSYSACGIPPIDGGAKNKASVLLISRSCQWCRLIYQLCGGPRRSHGGRFFGQPASASRRSFLMVWAGEQ